METRARYLAIGLFTIFVIAAGFAFVYWLYSGGGFGERSTYRIRFESPVSGLLVGSAVLFNGIHVGEVTNLDLTAEAPEQVLATIAIDPATPVRADTKVGIDFQGLTGAPVILLKGGSAGAPAIATKDGAVAMLIADPEAGQSMTEAARTTLKRFDSILSDNADALHTVIANFKTFSDALARNSERVDSVIAGLERMTGGAVARGKVAIYTLAAVHDFPPLDEPKRGQILIPEPAALMSLSSDKILIAQNGSEGVGIENALWSDNLPVLFQAKVVESFENSGYFQAVSRPVEGFEADDQILLELRTFRIVTAPQPAAVVAFAAKILSGGHMSATHVSEASVPIAAADGASAVAGLNTAFLQATKQLVLWGAQSAAAPTKP
jgi:phospholipid/cholesterol/gamma-HCH transport system substrate-binding protein